MWDVQRISKPLVGQIACIDYCCYFAVTCVLFRWCFDIPRHVDETVNWVWNTDFNIGKYESVVRSPIMVDDLMHNRGQEVLCPEL
jgi:hypothetical protein